MNTIELKKENVTAAYSIADEKTQKVLVALFGNIAKRPEPTLDDYKTIQKYEDACVALGEDPIDETELAIAGVPFHIIALMKLETISRALWGRNFTPMQKPSGSSMYRYPVFFIYTKNEIERMSKEDKAGILPIIDSAGADAGFGFADTCNAPSGTSAYFGSRLCQESHEKAAYFGRRFIRLWADYYLYKLKTKED